MQAVVIREHGGPEVLRLEDRERPRPGPGEALVRVRACALNHLDIWVRLGIPGVKFPLPLVPGSDVAGVVEDPGPAGDEFPAGSPVLVAPGLSCGRCRECAAGRDNLCPRYGILGETRDGGCAEYVAVPAVNLLPFPEGLPFESAAAIPLVFLTAWHMVVTRGGVRPGETVLVQAAGSGIGTAAIQIAKLWGATVIATAGSDGKLERAKELGADHGINYATADLAAEVRRITGKRGVDLAIDHVGEATWDAVIRSLARGGRLVTCGATTGAEARTNLRYVFFKNLSVLGSTMGSRSELYEVLAHVRAGRLRPVLDRTFPLAEAAAAHRHLEAR
ncbi:MAG: zinc-binding dehydrogenase, partial [Acidobacteria bacterium]|nr:zinc-binding dehydrogenase [Acidobacteriota bacterium]